MDSSIALPLVVLVFAGVSFFLGQKVGYKKGVKDATPAKPKFSPRPGEAGGGGC